MSGPVFCYLESFDELSGALKSFEQEWQKLTCGLGKLNKSLIGSLTSTCQFIQTNWNIRVYSNQQTKPPLIKAKPPNQQAFVIPASMSIFLFFEANETILCVLEKFWAYLRQKSSSTSNFIDKILLKRACTRRQCSRRHWNPLRKA